MLLREFAVDPGLFRDFPSMQYVLDGMGIHTGRMLAKFPKDWQKRAYATCESLSPAEKSRAEIRLARVKNLFLTGGRPFDKSRTWLENALVEHVKSPFHGVVAVNDVDNGVLGGDIVKAEDLDPACLPWQVSIDCVQSRDAASLCDVAKPLLHISKEIVFVDRYFAGGANHGRPLAAFLAEAFQGAQPTRIEYHCDDRVPFSHFSDQIRRMDRFLTCPVGFSIRFIRWKQIPEGDSPHPRYILTDRGGMRYDFGLSEDEGKTTDIGLIGMDVYARRMMEYCPEGTAFEFADGVELRDHTLYHLKLDNGFFEQDGQI